MCEVIRPAHSQQRSAAEGVECVRRLIASSEGKRSEMEIKPNSHRSWAMEVEHPSWMWITNSERSDKTSERRNAA